MKFETGRIYKTSYAGDHNLFITMMVISRTAKTIKAAVAGQVKSLRISDNNGVEFVYPTGRYTMCPVIMADSLL